MKGKAALNEIRRVRRIVSIHEPIRTDEVLGLKREDIMRVKLGSMPGNYIRVECTWDLPPKTFDISFPVSAASDGGITAYAIDTECPISVAYDHENKCWRLARYSKYKRKWYALSVSGKLFESDRLAVIGGRKYRTFREVMMAAKRLCAIGQ